MSSIICTVFIIFCLCYGVLLYYVSYLHLGSNNTTLKTSTENNAKLKDGVVASENLVTNDEFVRRSASLRAAENSPQLTVSRTTDAVTPHPIIHEKVEAVPDNDIDAVTDIVECSTTQGNITIDVRSRWGPLGSARFLSMVEHNFFDDLPFFRVCPRYITQFGVKYQTDEDKKNMPKFPPILDDPSLYGKRDMDFGYIFFAGSGSNSRAVQMVVALCPMAGCVVSTLGHAKWEVPIATIRKENFEVLLEIAKSGFPYPKLEMKGQHPDASGPNQGKIRNIKDYLKDEYPQMQFWKGCHRVTAPNTYVASRPLSVDHPDSKQRAAPSSFKPSKEPVNTLKNSQFIELFIAHGSPNVNSQQQLDKLTVEVMPTWSPIGASRLIDIVSLPEFRNVSLFRVIKGFVAQFGILESPADSAKHCRTSKTGELGRIKSFPDEKVVGSNTRGTLAFAAGGKNNRSPCQLFINLGNNKGLDREGFTPVARVVNNEKSLRDAALTVEVNSILDSLYAGYLEGKKKSKELPSPNQGKLMQEGNAYLYREGYDKLSYIHHVNVL